MRVRCPLWSDITQAIPVGYEGAMTHNRYYQTITGYERPPGPPPRGSFSRPGGEGGGGPHFLLYPIFSLPIPFFFCILSPKRELTFLKEVQMSRSRLSTRERHLVKERLRLGPLMRRPGRRPLFTSSPPVLIPAPVLLRMRKNLSSRLLAACARLLRGAR